VPDIEIAGAGPAGGAAAIASLAGGASVHIFERSHAPRHKVCGEFIPAEACAALERLGVWPDVLRLNPPRIRRCVLHFGVRRKQWQFDDPGIGLSRLQLDRLLLERASSLGARVSRGTLWQTGEHANGPLILAAGRKGIGEGRRRLFGFKSHFDGPTGDAIDLYFTPWGYCGVSAVENGVTNICGLAPEDVLRDCHFDIDQLLLAHSALAARVRPLSRRMPWLKTGPLCFTGPIGSSTGHPAVYRAGDALGFVDPFSGSGILHALLTGSLAGAAAARQLPHSEYLRHCGALLNRPFAVSAVFRLLLRAGLSHLALLVPGPWLYRLTRAHPGLADA